MNLDKSLRHNSSLKEDNDVKSSSHAYKRFHTVSIRFEKKYFIVSTLKYEI